MKIVLVRDGQKFLCWHCPLYCGSQLLILYEKCLVFYGFSFLPLKRIFSIVEESLEVTIFIISLPKLVENFPRKKHYQSHSIKTSWSLEDITIISLYPSMYIVKSYHLIQVKVFCSSFATDYPRTHWQDQRGGPQDSSRDSEESFP